MRFFPFLGAFSVLVMALAGCAGSPDRHAALNQLNPAPMTPAVWSRLIGTYTGPIHSSTIRFGFEGQSSTSVRLDLSGWADDPGVVFRFDKGYSTAWTMYGEKKGTFTNIPARRYGSQGTVVASTHYPDQILLVLRRDTTFTHANSWMILTYLGNGRLDVDWIGHSGWRGSGELWRSPELATSD
jgi:hypothetical protein